METIDGTGRKIIYLYFIYLFSLIITIMLAILIICFTELVEEELPEETVGNVFAMLLF